MFLFHFTLRLTSVMDVVFGALAYWLLGYGLSYGEPSNPFCGLGEFCPLTDPFNDTQSGLHYSQYLFQFSFAATATTIVSGAVAMRLKFGVYCAYSFYGIFVYAFVAHWVWAPNGWLRQLGARDVSGSNRPCQRMAS